MELEYVWRFVALMIGMVIFANSLVRVVWEFWSWGIMVLHDERPVISGRPSVEVRMEVWFAAVGAAIVVMILWGGGK